MSASSSPSDLAPRRARVAVSALFAVNGALLSNWAPRIPEIKAALALGDGALGLALLGTGLGALAGSLAGGALVARVGSRMATVGAAVALAAVLALPALAPSALLLGAALAVLGFADGAMDVAMNAHGVVVQQRYGRSILNGFHGFWSLGAVAGGLLGALAAGAGVPVGVHLGIAGVVLGLAALAGGRWLLPSGVDRVGAAPPVVLPTRAIGIVGLLTLLAAFVEDVPPSWSAVYLVEDLGTRPGVAGLGFAAFTAAMTVGRLVGDRLVERAGAVGTARAGALLVAVGLFGSLLIGSVPAALVGFACVGLGISSVFPLAFSAAGRQPGLPPGAAIGMVSLIARFGFLVGPPIVGALAEVAGLPAALGAVAVAALAIAALARGLEA